MDEIEATDALNNALGNAETLAMVGQESAICDCPGYVRDRYFGMILSQLDIAQSAAGRLDEFREQRTKSNDGRVVQIVKDSG